MLKYIAKYLPQSSIKLSLIFGIITGIAFFFIFHSTSGKIGMSLLFGLGGLILIPTIVFFQEKSGKRHHRTLIQSKKYKLIQDHFNFQIETRNNNEYWGLKGYYKDYFVRLTYDWNLGKINIIINYQMPKRSDGKLNTVFLDKVNRKYQKDSSFSSVKRIYDASHIRIFVGGFTVGSPQKMISIIEESVNSLIEVKLLPINENDVEHLIKNDKYMHEPWVESFK